MHELPHHYHVTAEASADSEVALSSPGLGTLPSAPPAEFGGPGDKWSPETLLTAAVADCFVLSFRAIARASKLDWTTLSCEVEGVLDRTDRKMQFTGFTVRARLSVPAGTDTDRAHRLLEKAEQSCLITNSLNCPCHLAAEVLIADGA